MTLLLPEPVLKEITHQTVVGGGGGGGRETYLRSGSTPSSTHLVFMFASHVGGPQVKAAHSSSQQPEKHIFAGGIKEWGAAGTSSPRWSRTPETLVRP